jgi:hypothetical protein
MNPAHPETNVSRCALSTCSRTGCEDGEPMRAWRS